MANISGVRTVYGIGTKETGGRIAVDMRDQIAQLEPNESPFITFLRASKKNTRVAHNPKFEWMEDKLVPNATTLATAIAANNTTSVVVATGDGKLFRAGTILMASTEAMQVTAVSTDTLTVTRGFGGTTALASIALNTPIYIIGTPNAENATCCSVHSGN